MGKLDVGVGDDFPVDEPPPPSQDTEETVRAAREEWRRQKDEWRQRKEEWRQHRDAFKEDMRTRGRAFKADVRQSFHENFGDRPYVRGFRPGGFVARILIGLAVLALIIAFLPFFFMFGFIALAVALVFVALTRGRHHDYPPNYPPSRPNA